VPGFSSFFTLRLKIFFFKIHPRFVGRNDPRRKLGENLSKIHSHSKGDISLGNIHFPGRQLFLAPLSGCTLEFTYF